MREYKHNYEALLDSLASAVVNAFFFLTIGISYNNITNTETKQERVNAIVEKSCGSNLEECKKVVISKEDFKEEDKERLTCVALHTYISGSYKVICDDKDVVEQKLKENEERVVNQIWNYFND